MWTKTIERTEMGFVHMIELWQNVWLKSTVINLWLQLNKGDNKSKTWHGVICYDKVEHHRKEKNNSICFPIELRVQVPGDFDLFIWMWKLRWGWLWLIFFRSITVPVEHRCRGGRLTPSTEIVELVPKFETYMDVKTGYSQLTQIIKSKMREQIYFTKLLCRSYKEHNTKSFQVISAPIWLTGKHHSFIQWNDKSLPRTDISPKTDPWLQPFTKAE